MKHDSDDLTTAQAAAMLKLQDRLNSIINPQWIRGNARFLRAAFVESAEALEHYGWKWWKKQTTDLPQVQMELIDILHFYLSHTLVEQQGRTDTAARALVDQLKQPAEILLDGRKYLLEELDVRELLELIGALAACGRLNYKVLDAAMRACAIGWQEVFGQYVSKNVLNIFRQENGYKDGTYVKIWKGEEDNVVLARLMAEIEADAPDYAERLHLRLSEEYSKIGPETRP